jgi:hypothetical protein
MRPQRERSQTSVVWNFHPSAQRAGCRYHELVRQRLRALRCLTGGDLSGRASGRSIRQQVCPLSARHTKPPSCGLNASGRNRFQRGERPAFCPAGDERQSKRRSDHNRVETQIETCPLSAGRCVQVSACTTTVPTGLLAYSKSGWVNWSNGEEGVPLVVACSS